LTALALPLRRVWPGPVFDVMVLMARTGYSAPLGHPCLSINLSINRQRKVGGDFRRVGVPVLF